MQTDEKSVGASSAQSLYGIALEKKFAVCYNKFIVLFNKGQYPLMIYLSNKFKKREFLQYPAKHLEGGNACFCRHNQIMDVFKEQIVRKVPSKNEKASRIFIMIASVALAMLCFLFPLAYAMQFVMFGIFFAGASLYGGYYLVTNLDVEYEYIMTNGEMDFDKITAQRRRKRLCSIRFGAATEFGVANDAANTGGAETYVRACADDPEQTDYFVRLNHKSLGDTVVYFTPSDEMLELIKPYLPRALRTKSQI